MTIYDQRSGQWEFHKGPVFASIVLADEINRASPKTQSALLEVMEESQITVDGKTHSTGRPSWLSPPKTPLEQAGTYPLPEAQLDRFLMKPPWATPSVGLWPRCWLTQLTPTAPLNYRLWFPPLWSPSWRM